MRRLLHWVGKALYFAANKMEGEHFIIEHTGKVPEFIKNAQRKINTDRIACSIMDIEGCFPNMPKETIRFAIRGIFKQLQKQGKKGVSVPRRSTAKPCIWKQCEDASYVWLTSARRYLMCLAFH